MKKTIKFLIIIFAMIWGLLYVFNIGVNEVVLFVQTDCFVYTIEEKYQEKYYYNQLTDFEKKVYLLIAKNTEAFDDKMFIIKDKDIEYEDVSIHVNKANEFYRLDNPEVFYLKNKLEIATYESNIYSVIEIQISYLCSKEESIIMKSELEDVVQDIIDNNISDLMTDYEKEKVIYDYILNNVIYFKYDDKENIPDIQHSSYGALIQGSAVCDGFSKAFKMIMDEINVATILINGETTDLHAWNIIFLDGDAYHIDVTSGKQEVNENEYIINYVYFNLTDQEIEETHEILNKESLPVCDSIKYNYYYKEDLIVYKTDKLRLKLEDIIEKTKENITLEFKVEDEDIDIDEITKALYFLNFNEYKYKINNYISYYKINDKYIIVKD